MEHLALDQPLSTSKHAFSHIKENATSLYESESNASLVHFDKVRMESIKSKTNFLIEDKTVSAKKIKEGNIPNEEGSTYLKTVVENSNSKSPMGFEDEVLPQTFNKNLDIKPNVSHMIFQEQQKDESIIASGKVFTAIHLLDILLTLIFYLDNRRHKNDIQDKKNIFVESTNKYKKERTKRVGTGDSEKSFLASQQKTSLEHYKDYLFASHHHNYDQKRGFDFFSTTSHNNAFHHPYFSEQNKVENVEKGFKNRFLKQENNGNISENDRKKDAKLGSTKHSSFVLPNSFNHKRTKNFTSETLVFHGLNKNHSMLDNEDINDIKPYLAIINPSKNLTKSKSNTITRLDNPSHNISSSTDGENVLEERKMDSNVNKTLNISDSFIPHDTKLFHSSIESEKHNSNLTKILDNSFISLKDKFNQNDSLDNSIGGALDFETDAITIANTANFISSSNYPEKDLYHPTTFNQINESLHQPNVVVVGKNISFVSSNITSSSMKAAFALDAATTQPQQLFNNSYLNSKTEIQTAEAEKLTTRTSLQPPIFHPKNFSYFPLNVKMEHSVVIPSPLLATSKPTSYHKNKDTQGNGKDQEQRKTNDSHYHKILAKKSKEAGGGNFSSGSLASNMHVKYSPFLTPSLPQIIHTIRKWLGNNLTGNNETNFISGDIARITGRNDVKERKNKRKILFENISKDGFEKDHKSSERDVKKNMSDDVGYGLYDENERKSKNGFEGSGLWPENNRSGGIIITLLEKVIDDMAMEEGKKAVKPI